MKHLLPLFKPTRLILSLLSVILCTPLLSAKVRTADEARKIAESHLSTRSVSAARLSNTASTRSGADNYYAFDIDGSKGYVIVAADDRFQDILGYADKGSFSSALKNPNFSFWLSSLSEEMQTAPKTSKPRPTRAVNAVDVAPLLKTRWGQGKPYNAYCPWVYNYSTHETVQAPTGCVATAMAQVLRYHQWPQSYTNNAGETYDYKWNLMADSYSYDGTEPEEAIDQVASLMRHCGESVNMQYAADGSSAYNRDMADALISRFGYDPSTLRILVRDNYGYEELHNILYAELSEGRPVLTRGDYPGAVGHAFVLDGSTSDGFFHFNWGWDGFCDGYYRLTSLQPEEYGTGGSLEGYSFDVEFTVGVKPARSEVTDTQKADLSAISDLKLNNESNLGEQDYSGKMEIVVTTEPNGQMYGFLNTGMATFMSGADDTAQGRIHTLLTNVATGEQTLSEQFHTLGFDLYPDYFIKTARMYIDNLADNTTYRASLVFKNGAADTPHPVRFAPGTRSYILIERKGGKVIVTEPSAESAITGTIPADLDRIVRGGSQIQSFSINISNPGDTEYLGQVKWKYTDEYGYTNDKYTDYAMVNLLPGEEAETEFKLFRLNKVEPGTYTIGLYDLRDRLIGETRNVKIENLTVPINETAFPDPVLRELIAANFDQDQDGSLSEQELSNRHELSFNGFPISDFTGIEYFYDTYRVIVQNAEVSEIKIPSSSTLGAVAIFNSPIESLVLGDLPQLASLQLNYSEVSDLDLSAFGNLQDVDVDDNKLVSLILPKSGRLRAVYCQRNLLKDLDIAGLSNIYLLYFTSNQISGIDLSELEGLQFFASSGNPVESLDLTGKDKLTRAYLDNCNIKELAMSASYPSLISLSAHYNSIEGTLDLSGCPALVDLNLSGNKLSEVKLCDMPDLTDIDLSNNGLSGKINLSASPLLESVYLNGNEFSELILGNVENLYSFNISDNDFSGVIDLSGAENLMWLYVQNNRLEGITLGMHPSLEMLYIYNNQIEGCLDISGMPNLLYLFASDNRISEFRSADHPRLMTLDLKRNALTHVHADDLQALVYRDFSEQNLSANIDTPDFDLSPMIAAGFDTDRASNWRAEWMEGSDRRSADCEVRDGFVIIPQEAGRDLELTYYYTTHRNNNWISGFSINLTREGFGSVDGMIADGSLYVNGNSIVFADGISGEIYTTGGVSLFKGTGESPALPSGIYIVRIGSSVAKIAIR